VIKTEGGGEGVLGGLDQAFERRGSPRERVFGPYLTESKEASEKHAAEKKGSRDPREAFLKACTKQTSVWGIICGVGGCRKFPEE